jgi:hypothetical protein
MEPVIRQAELAGRAVIERIVRDAYIRHVSRLGRARSYAMTGSCGSRKVLCEC